MQPDHIRGLTIGLRIVSMARFIFENYTRSGEAFLESLGIYRNDWE